MKHIAQAVTTWLLAAGFSLNFAPAFCAEPLEFVVHEIGRPGGQRFGQTSLVDVDRDGDLDFVSGQRAGTIFWFEYRGPADWVRHVVGEDARTDVGGVAFDVDLDGWIDQVSGAVWYRNPGRPRELPFQRFVSGAIQTHDNLCGDINGDGRQDLISLVDEKGVFWYEIPSDPTQSWIEHQVLGRTEPQCHGGIAIGDLDGDGDNDLTRLDRWLENSDGKGQLWHAHQVFDFGKVGPWGIQTRAAVVDLDADGDLDLVQAEGDVLDGRVAWFENQDGQARKWSRHLIKMPGHHQDFHSLCVADFDGDGDLDVFSGGGPLTQGAYKWFVWTNENGKGNQWHEHVIATGYRTHESVCGDVDRDGDIDIVTKPWNGDLHLFVENLSAH